MRSPRRSNSSRFTTLHDVWWPRRIFGRSCRPLGGRGPRFSVVDGLIIDTPARDECWAAQTPQVIRRDWLAEAIVAAARSGRLGTDDAQLVEWLGHPVRMVEARFPNPKITRPEDLVLAEKLLEKAAGATEGVVQ